MKVTIEEVAALLGTKDIEIMSLQKELAAANQRIAELEKPKEDKPA